ADADAPHRLEFFGDEIESIRQFSPQTQRSLRDLQTVELLGTAVEQPPPHPTLSPSKGGEGRVRGDNGDHTTSSVLHTGHLCDYLPADAWTMLVEPEDLQEQGKHYLERVADPRGLFSVQGVFQQLLRFPSVQES